MSVRISGCKETSTCLVAQSIEVLEDNFEASAFERSDVLDEGEVGRLLAEDPRVLGPQARSASADPLALAGVADVDAGESAANESGASNSGPSEGGDVVVSVRVGPVVGEDLSSERRELDLPGDLAARGDLDCELEETDSGEERSDRELFFVKRHLCLALR